MNGNIKSVHVYTTTWIVGAMLSLILLVNQARFSVPIFVLVSIIGVGLIIDWVYSFYQKNTGLNKSALILGSFGVGMFLFSYAMVPMYHLVCHAAASVTSQVIPQSVELDMIARPYRQLPVLVKLDQMRLDLLPEAVETVYADLYNDSDDELSIRLNLVTQPRALANQFEVVLPKVIQMEPHQYIRLPVQVKFLGFTESLSQASIMLLLQDQQDEGELGKTDAWKKMSKFKRS
jgi:hypothetical protein